MYTHPRQLVTAVCGGSELLMWDVDKMITSIDFEVKEKEKDRQKEQIVDSLYRKEIIIGLVKEQYFKIYMYPMNNSWIFVF
jgi:hypothetical protein